MQPQQPQDLMLATFQGSYRVAHPDGFQDQNVLNNFEVDVQMSKEFLETPGLNAPFRVYYQHLVKSVYPDMIDLYRWELVQATELDGTPIENPKALSYSNLIDYINKKKYPINIGLFTPAELRNEVILYEQDAKGQQHLQELQENIRGASLRIGQQIAALGKNAIRRKNPAVTPELSGVL